MVGSPTLYLESLSAVNACPACGKPLMYKAVRCLECGHQLAFAPVSFDLADDPLPTAPTWSKSALIDRWVGALMPFAISLLWLGVVCLVQPANLATLSIYAAPFLRFLLPLLASRAWKDRYPWLSTGFRNALWSSVAFALVLGVTLIVAIPLWIVGGFFNFLSRWNTPGSEFDTGVRLTPALLATTFMAQGLLAGFLPPAAVITKQGVRLPKQTRIAESLLGTLLVLFLAARWLLPAHWRNEQTVAAGGAGVILTMLGCLRAIRSEHLNTSQRIVVSALVLMLGGLTFWAVQ